MTSMATKRIARELQILTTRPDPFMRVFPRPDDILSIHVSILGPQESSYQGGLYHLEILLPQDYPQNPPHIHFLSESGRFAVNADICTTFTHYHQESWNPTWTIASVVTGLRSMFCEDNAAIGSILASSSAREEFARRSVEYECAACGCHHRDLVGVLSDGPGSAPAGRFLHFSILPEKTERVLVPGLMEVEALAVAGGVAAGKSEQKPLGAGVASASAGQGKSGVGDGNGDVAASGVSRPDGERGRSSSRGSDAGSSSGVIDLELAAPASSRDGGEGGAAHASADIGGMGGNAPCARSLPEAHADGSPKAEGPPRVGESRVSTSELASPGSNPGNASALAETRAVAVGQVSVQPAMQVSGASAALAVSGASGMSASAVSAASAASVDTGEIVSLIQSHTRLAVSVGSSTRVVDPAGVDASISRGSGGVSAGDAAGRREGSRALDRRPRRPASEAPASLAAPPAPTAPSVPSAPPAEPPMRFAPLLLRAAVRRLASLR